MERTRRQRGGAVVNQLDSLLDIYMSNGMTEREAFAQLKEDALKGREIRKDKSEKSVNNQTD